MLKLATIWYLKDCHLHLETEKKISVSWLKSWDILNYRFLTTETNLKALYIIYIYISLFVYNLISKAIFSDCTDFCLQLYFSEKGKTTLTKPFTFWKWKHISKKNHILEMKAHSETHFENENMFLEKWKVINL